MKEYRDLASGKKKEKPSKQKKRKRKEKIKKVTKCQCVQLHDPFYCF